MKLTSFRKELGDESLTLRQHRIYRRIDIRRRRRTSLEYALPMVFQLTQSAYQRRSSGFTWNAPTPSTLRGACRLRNRDVRVREPKFLAERSVLYVSVDLHVQLLSDGSPLVGRTFD